VNNNKKEENLRIHQPLEKILLNASAGYVNGEKFAKNLIILGIPSRGHIIPYFCYY
jgi:hypothetical protein